MIFTTPPATMMITGRLTKPWAWRMELHTSIMHTNRVARPRVDSRGPASWGFRLGKMRAMMGSPRTKRPTAMGQAARAEIRRAEPVIRPAPRRSRRASAPETAGMTAAVTAAIREVGRL